MAKQCFKCKAPFVKGKQGKRKNGSRWYLCAKCCAENAVAREAHKTLDNGWLEASGQSVKMGWNGVPSERSLRRRSR